MDGTRPLHPDALAILESLSGHLVFIDSMGIIRYLNAAWHQFARNHLPSERVQSGDSYLPAYTRIVDLDTRDVALLEEALHHISQGVRDAIIIEHPYHSPTAHGWVALHITACQLHDDRGILIQQHDITEQKHAEATLRLGESQFRSLVENIPGAVYRCATSAGWPMFFISPGVEALSGYPASDFLQNSVRTFGSLIVADDLPMVEQANMDGIVAKRPFTIEYRIIRANGHVAWIYEKGQGVYDAAGNVQWIDGVIFDITERKQAEALLTQAARQELMIQAQTATIAALSTPLIPISETVLIMPLIGTIDTARAQQIIMALLEGIARVGVETVIIDITGIPMMDSAVATTLLNAAKGARLLGTTMILTGIRPEVAQTLVHLNISLTGMLTESTLQRGIAVALQRRL